jgi:hypothetical protein
MGLVAVAAATAEPLLLGRFGAGELAGSALLQQARSTSANNDVLIMRKCTTNPLRLAAALVRRLRRERRA